ncbi:MAG: hypothetical protein U0414_29145 [Polyangiaceae bacterium]
MKAPSEAASQATVEAATENAPSDPNALPEAVLDAVDRSAERARAEAPAQAFGSLALAFVLRADDDGIEVRVGGRSVPAKAAPSLHRAILDTAMRTGEPVLIERQADGSLSVVGGLRTRPTPGVDETREIHLEADRVHIKGRKEIVLSTEGVASLALRAAGEIETYADRIVSRAEELHRIVGRMLRLN